MVDEGNLLILFFEGICNIDEGVLLFKSGIYYLVW